MARTAPKHAQAKKAAPARQPAKKPAKKAAAKAGRAAARTSPSRTAPRRRAPAKKPTGPHGRLGVLWAAATLPFLLLGPIPLALWMAAHAGLAGIQTARSHTHAKRPNPLATGVGAALLALGCAIGWPGAVVGLVLAASVPIVLPGVLRAETSDPRRTVTLAVSLGAAAGSLVLARALGAMPALVLFALMCAHDTGNYLVGSGASSNWEGPAAGVAAMGPVILGAATVAVPPFTESGVWVLGAIAAVLIPLGPHGADRLIGRRAIRLPALRRLDALLLAGPVWALAATLLKR